jgi:signal transduction histidine kinase
MVASEARRQEALIQAGITLASELSLPAILQKIVELACEVADARYGALGVLGPDGTIEEFVTHGVTEEQRRAIGHLPRGRGILGALIVDAKPLRLERIQDDPRSVGFPPNHPPMTTFLGVPVKVRDRVYGNLYLTERVGGGSFEEDDERAVVTLAAQAGVAIETARNREELERLAVLEDRERIARELHDGVVQSLFAVGLSLQAASSMPGDAEAVSAKLGDAVEHIDRVIRDLRNYIFGLGAGSGVADRELGRALEDLAEEFRRGSDVAVRVRVEPEAASRLAPVAADVLQVAREAVSNATRHGGGETLSISLLRDGSATVLEVDDDGVGFDLAAVGGRGRGLANLRSRAEDMGATLDLDTAPGRGTAVRLRVPD